jgi:hypothetical protein
VPVGCQRIQRQVPGPLDGDAVVSGRVVEIGECGGQFHAIERVLVVSEGAPAGKGGVEVRARQVQGQRKAA